MSVHDKVHKSISQAREAFTQTPLAVPESSADYAQVKTNVGITYNRLSKTVVEGVAEAVNCNGIFRSVDKARLMDELHLSPRLNQWHLHGDTGFKTWRLWTKDDGMYVDVSQDQVKIVKGIRNFAIAEKLPALALYNALSDSQRIVGNANGNYLDAGDEEFFATDALAVSANLDVALEDTAAQGQEFFGDGVESGLLADDVPTVEETVEQDIKEKFADAKVASRRDTHLVEVDDDSEGQTQKAFLGSRFDVHEDKGGYTQKFNDGQLKDNPVKDCPRMETTLVVNRVKSLQGKMLGIIDASFNDKEQRAAVKTLINKEFRREITKLNNGVHYSTDED